MTKNGDGRPVIGLTADTEARQQSDAESVYVLRKNYAEAVARSGAIPVIIPHDVSLADFYVAHLNGLIITGGMFDIHPRRYGATASGAVNTNDGRTDFELALLRSALQLGLPVLGICNGMQLLAVAHGGTLTQDIPGEVRGAIEHMPKTPADGSHHAIHIVPDSMLAAITGLAETRVNSVHHQAVKQSSGYRVAAKAPDGVVEAIEIPGQRFCLGLQWHPEYGSSDADSLILRAFVAACSDPQSSPKRQLASPCEV